MSRVRAACAILYDRTLKCWGRGDNGRLGYDSTDSKGDVYPEMASIAAVDLGYGKTAKHVMAGCSHTCVELNDGSLKCWGEGAHGRLGYNSTDDLGDEPGEMASLQPVFADTMWSRVTSVVSGAHHSCALFSNGRVKCWGDAASGQLGYDSTSDRGDAAGEMVSLPDVNLGPSNLPYAAGQWTALQITAGDYHTCALLNTGFVKCWGSGGYGRLGQDNTHNYGQTTSSTARRVYYMAVVNLGLQYPDPARLSVIGFSSRWGGTRFWAAR